MLQKCALDIYTTLDLDLTLKNRFSNCFSDLLSPAGPSPMSAGLYMALACCLGRGK